MNKVVTGILILGFATAAQAKNYGAAGCGLGSKIFEGQSGVGPNVLAASTNGFYGTQTFAMSSGTLGCDVNGPIRAHIGFYIDSNLDNIAQDIARGEGEALDALVDVMDIDAADKSEFTETLQLNFDVIFSSENAESGDVINALVVVLNNNEKLAKYTS